MIKWSGEDNVENILWLLTPDEFKELPNGTLLRSITYEDKIKGLDYIDDDTRFGVLGYGLTPAMAKAQGLMDKFIIWKLKS
jgi:hypothetical protein